MLIATALFVVLLVAVHLADPSAVDRPLSLFRDGPWPVAGYALFGLLLVIGGLHLRTYYRLARYGELVVPAAALGLLAVVTLTPSLDGGHAFAAFALMGLMFIYYAVRLYRAGSLWFFAHLAAPVLLIVATSCRSYGVWQKGFIVYFLLAANLDCLLATGRLALPGPEDFVRRRRRKRAVKYAPRVLWRRTNRPPGG